MTLDSNNYYSLVAGKEYMSVSQYKAFCGTYGCEAREVAKLAGEYQEGEKTAFLIGSYVDSFFEGTLPQFTAAHPEIFKRDGTLKADYVLANAMIDKATSDTLFMRFMAGEKQTIFTADIFGTAWKCKLDVLHRGKCIVDLKTTQGIHKGFYSDGNYKNFISQFGYYTQAAIYQKAVEINTGEHLPFYIAAISKEETPEIEIIQLEQEKLDVALYEVEANLPHVLEVKNGLTAAARCEKCDYCRKTKKLTVPIWSADIKLF